MAAGGASSGGGRPRISVDREQLEFLRSLHFKWTDIAGILGVSEKTVHRRVLEWNIPTYSSISDHEVDVIVRRYLEEFPQCGEAMLRGHFLSLNLHIQRERLRQSVKRITGSEQRNTQQIYRRVYSVPGPNFLWHIDGHHKLIKWRLVTHGGIDGFSRLITYLQCSNNNESETVTECFIKATYQFGTPSRVRSDHGTENVGVWRFMEEVRGRDRNSYIAGRSVHNCRIERLWRDVYTCVISTYVQLFTYMEEEGILNADNDADIFCLHYIFVPRINNSLLSFREAWNNHPLSSERNRSPLQLYTGGSLGNPMFEEQIDFTVYGVDFEAIADDMDEEASVVIPVVDIGLSNSELQELKSNLEASVNPVQLCDDYGLQLYKTAVEILFQFIDQQRLIENMSQIITS